MQTVEGYLFHLQYMVAGAPGSEAPWNCEKKTMEIAQITHLLSLGKIEEAERLKERCGVAEVYEELYAMRRTLAACLADPRRLHEPFTPPAPEGNGSPQRRGDRKEPSPPQAPPRAPAAPPELPRINGDVFDLPPARIIELIELVSSASEHGTHDAKLNDALRRMNFPRPDYLYLLHNAHILQIAANSGGMFPRPKPKERHEPREQSPSPLRATSHESSPAPRAASDHSLPPSPSVPAVEPSDSPASPSPPPEKETVHTLGEYLSTLQQRAGKQGEPPWTPRYLATALQKIRDAKDETEKKKKRDIYGLPEGEVEVELLAILPTLERCATDAQWQETVLP